MSTTDVEMKPLDGKTDEMKKEEEKKDEKPPLTPAQEIRANVALIERGVSLLEPRFVQRVLRGLASLRHRINPQILREAIEEIYPNGMHTCAFTQFVVILVAYLDLLRSLIFHTAQLRLAQHTG